MSVAHLVLALLVLICYPVLVYVVSGRRSGFFSRHRVLTAVLLLPYQPLLLIGIVALLITVWKDVEIRGVVLGCVAYLNGLVAFALTTAIQDRRQN